MDQESATLMIEANTEPLVVQASRDLAVKVRAMEEQQRCDEGSALETTFVSDTQAYGVMFTVRGKKEEILIETLELSSAYLGNQRGVHVMVYTKDGDYQNYHDKPGDWVKIADTVVKSAKEGRGTLIPVSDFHPVQVKPGRQRAFYVTLDTTDLRYSNSPGRPVGSVYSEDHFLQIEVGAGLLEYPFSRKIFEPRVFCGIVHYKRIIDCNKVTMVDSTVPYHFIVQHDSLSDRAIISHVNDIVSGTVKALLGSDVELSTYRTSADLNVNSFVTDISSIPFNPQAFAECSSNTIRKCTPVMTKMKFSHNDKLSTGELIYLVLKQRSQVSANLNAVKAIDAIYAGFIPLRTDLVLRVEGIPAGQTMNAKQIAYFEETTHKFIDEMLIKTPSVDILTIHVKDQGIVDSEHRHLQDTHELGSLDVITTVTATLKPPPMLNLRVLTEDAIAFNAAEYIDDLKSRRDLQLGLLDSTFFAEIKSVTATRTQLNGTIDEYAAARPTGGGQSLPGWAIFLIVLVVMKFVGLMYYLRRRRLRQNQYEKEQQTINDDDDYDAQIYETPFREVVDDKDAELIYRQGFEENRRTLGMTKAHSMPDRIMAPPGSTRNLATAASVSHLTSTRSMGSTGYGYPQSQRSLMSQRSAKDVTISAGYNPNQRGFTVQHSSGNIDQIPDSATSVRGMMPGDSAMRAQPQNSRQPGLTSQNWQGEQSHLSRSSRRMLMSQRSNGDMQQSSAYSPSERGLTPQGSKASISSSGYASSQRGAVLNSSRGDADQPQILRDRTVDSRPMGKTSNYSGRSSTQITSERENDPRAVGMSTRRSEYSSGASGRSSRMSQRSTGTWNVQGATSTIEDGSVKNSSVPWANASLVDNMGSISDAAVAVKFDDSTSVSASDHTLKRKNRVTFAEDQ